MAKDPAFLLYSSDFLTGVIGLTMEERGQYITMLCLQHQKGHLKEKTYRLCVGSVSVDVLNKFKKDCDGNLYSSRLDVEIEKRSLFTESRRENGKKGGRPVKQKPKNNLQVSGRLNYAEPVANLPENENDNVNGTKISIEKVPVNVNNNTGCFIEFVRRYPGNGLPNNEECRVYFCKLTDDIASEVAIKAREYVDYMHEKYGDDYEYSGFLKNAENWLKEEYWKKDWNKMRSLIKNEKKPDWRQEKESRECKQIIKVGGLAEIKARNAKRKKEENEKSKPF